MTTLLATVFVLGVLIVVHELGHFLVAKAVGIAVPRFSIGLGPRLVGIRWGETDYCLSAIPFGGYVKMAGEESAEELEGGKEEVRPPSPRDFDQKPLWARLAVIFAGSGMNFLWAIALFVGIFHWVGAETIPTTVVGEVRWAQGPIPDPLQGLVPGSRLLAVDGEPVATWDEVVMALARRGGGRLALDWVDPRGQRQSVVLSPASDSLRVRVARALQPLVPPRVGMVKKGGPADRAGIREGDRIVAIDRAPIHSWADAVDIIHSNPEVPLTLEMSRGDSHFTVQVTPARGKLPDSEQSFREVGLIGIWQSFERQRLSLGTSLIEGANRAVSLGGFILRTLGRLVIGELSPRLLGGPVLIGQMAGESARQGLSYLVGFMALFSVNLAILNLLPIPVLDGGHLLFLGAEMVRRRPLTLQQRARLSQVGLILLILLMVYVTANDGLRLLGF